MTEELVTLLLKNKDNNIKLSLNETYGNHYHCGSSYNTKNFTRTIGCKDMFVFDEEEKYDFNLRDYKYNVLYHHENEVSSKQTSFSDSYGKASYEYVKFRFIIEIYDKDNNKFFMYVNCSYVSKCGSCDGGTHYSKLRMVYSNDLTDLLNFIYTLKDIERLILEIKNYK
jgi:hypothetical protein